jgi:hypothetical protein
MAQRNMLTLEGREQKLVDICFSLVLTITHKEHAAIFAAKTNEEKAAWVAEQLRGCGFDTTPCGASWGLLKPDPISTYDRDRDNPLTTIHEPGRS